MNTSLTIFFTGKSDIVCLIEYSFIYEFVLLLFLQNIVIRAAFPETYFNVHYSTRNGTYHTVTALQRGKTNIDGALTTIIRQVINWYLFLF